jgi:hypothetical protein
LSLNTNCIVFIANVNLYIYTATFKYPSSDKFDFINRSLTSSDSNIVVFLVLVGNFSFINSLNLSWNAYIIFAKISKSYISIPALLNSVLLTNLIRLFLSSSIILPLFKIGPNSK